MNEVMSIGECDIRQEDADAVMDAERNALEKYFNEHASEPLKEKVKAEGKTFKGMWEWLMSRARAACEEGNVGVMTTDAWAYGEMLHYFEDEEEGAIYKSPKEIEAEKKRAEDEAKWKAEREKREAERKAADAKAEEEKLAAMTAEERLAYEREKARKEAEEAERKAAAERAAAEAARLKAEREAKKKAAEEKKRKAEELAKAQMTFF